MRSQWKNQFGCLVWKMHGVSEAAQIAIATPLPFREFACSGVAH